MVSTSVREKQRGIVLDKACINFSQSSHIRYSIPTLSDSTKTAPSILHLRQPRSSLTHWTGSSNYVTASKINLPSPTLLDGNQRWETIIIP